MAATPDRPLVVFDGDCAFCTTGITWFTRTFPGAFDTVPYQRTELAALGLTEAQCHDRLQWLTNRHQVGALGNRRSGARAVTAMLSAGGRARGGIFGAAARLLGAAGSYPPGSWVAAGVYAGVAANRMRLPGGTPACAARPGAGTTEAPEDSP